MTESPSPFTMLFSRHRRRQFIAGQLRHVDKWYRNNHVLVDVSLRVRRGEIVALVGRSGSGKSTVLRVLAGLSSDHTGERVVAGAPAFYRDIEQLSEHDLRRAELISFPFALISLLVVFGSVVASGVPVAVGGAEGTGTMGDR